MQKQQIFAIFLTTILLIDSGSAGLLQSIRDAAFLKDIIADSLSEPGSRESRPHRGLDLPEFSQIPEDEPSFFDRYSTPIPTPTPSPAPCPPGDFLCLARRSLKHTLGSEMSNAIITSVAGLMTEMLNTTISRSLDIVQSAQGSHDAQKEADARAAVNLMTTTISTVSSKVIQGLASFVKVSLSGAMWDMFNQVVKAARNGGTMRTLGQGARTRTNKEQVSTSSSSTEDKTISLGGSGIGSDPALATPSSAYPTQVGNEIRRSASDPEAAVALPNRSEIN